MGEVGEYEEKKRMRNAQWIIFKIRSFENY